MILKKFNRLIKKINWLKLLIIIVPVIFSWIFLFNPGEKYDLTRENTPVGKIVKVSPDEVFKPGIKTSLRNILGVPFNLQYYDVCFENNVDEDNISIFVKFNNLEEMYVPNGGTVCVPVLLNKPFSYRWIIKFNFQVNSSELYKQGFITKTIPVGGKLTTYAKPEIWSTLAKWILVFFAWSGLVLLSDKILKFIEK